MTKAEKEAKRRELKAWVALKRAQLVTATREARADLQRQIAEKRRRLRSPKRGTPAAFTAAKELADARALAAHRARKSAAKLGPEYETGDAFQQRMQRAKKAKKKKRRATRAPDVRELARRLKPKKKRAAKKRAKKRAAPKKRRTRRAKRR